MRSATLQPMRIALACAGVLLAGKAMAAPFATASADVDGDGKPDAIEVDPDGALRVANTKRATLRVPAQTAKGRIEVAKTSSGTWIVVEASGATEEAFVVNAKTWQVAATTVLGGVGLDREYSIEIAARPEGVFRYQKRFDVKRCDNKPAYLFPERLDAKAPVTPPLDITNPTALTAKVDPSTTQPLVYQARAASYQSGATDAGALAIPRELDDGNPATQWREDLATAGEGQFFTFTPRVEAARAAAIRIVPGNPTSAAAMKQMNRPHVIAIVSAKEAWRVELPDAANAPLGTAYVVELPASVAGCVTVMLESTYGKPQGTTAIAELQVFAEGERAGGGEALLAKIVAEGKGGEVAAAATLSRRAAAAAAALDAELAKTNDASARRRLVAALAKIADPAAVPPLLKAIAQDWVSGKDLLDVIATLGQSNQVQALAEIAGKGGRPMEIRVAAASKITPTGPGYDALVDLSGRGPREVRRIVIERLALAPAAQLAQTAGAPTSSGDVWRALTRRVRGHADERAAAITAMAAALANATDYEKRYRLIDGIAAYGDAQALANLDRFLQGLPVSSQSAALRQVAVNAIAGSPRPEATSIVIALARDADPGVRLAALSALANSETDASSAWHTADGPDGIDRVIINGLNVDTWPEVRRRAATALGARCQRTGPARALADAVAKDPIVDVRADALTALVQCKATGVRELLAKTWEDGKAPLELRERAVSLAITLGDAEFGKSLVAKFNSWRGEALSSAPALALSQQAAVAIGQLRAPGAVQALTSALEDSAFPEIQSAAAMGLGAMGDACPSAAKSKLLTLARGGSQSAPAARHAAGQCTGR